MVLLPAGRMLVPEFVFDKLFCPALRLIKAREKSKLPNVD